MRLYDLFITYLLITNSKIIVFLIYILLMFDKKIYRGRPVKSIKWSFQHGFTTVT